MVANDAANGGKAEASSFLRRFRGEKWIEDFFENFWRHTLPRIGYRNGDELTGYQLRLPSRAVVFQHGLLCGQHQRTAPRHRIPGVDAKIHHDLMELSRIAEDRR